MSASRWKHLVAGFAVTLCLGVVYAYSVLRVHLEEFFSETAERELSALELQAGYTVFLAVYSLSVMAGGRASEALGAKKTLLAGGSLLLLAWTLSSLAETPLEFAAPYGVLGGLGSGLAFSVVVSAAVKWFPEKSGFASGLAISGFGLSPLISGPLIDLLVENLGLAWALRALGLAVFAVIASASVVIDFPPVAEKPTAGGSPATARDLASLWLLFCLGTAVGLSTVGVSKSAGLEVAERAGLSLEEASRALTVAVSVFSVFNAAGRPLFGLLVDKLGVSRAAVIAYSLAGAALVAFYLGSSSLVVYAVAYSALWATLGGWLAISSGATRAVFGVESYHRVYGYVFTAYGAGALLGNLLLNGARDALGDYATAGLLLTPLLAVGAVVALLTPPREAARGSSRV
ncbi:MAG: MFS transporter [Acidilobaceae archaeon]